MEGREVDSSMRWWRNESVVDRSAGRQRAGAGESRPGGWWVRRPQGLLW